MGRKFSVIEEWEVYVPDVDDGADRAEFDEAEAFTVEIRYLTARDVKQYERILRTAKTRSEMDRVAEEYARRMFCDNVRNVRNYAPRGVDITTSEEVWNEGEPCVINDITRAMRERSRLEAGLAKKLRSQSATSSSGRPSNDDGGARGATQASSPTTQET